MSQPPNQPYPGQPYPNQPHPGQPGYPGQPAPYPGAEQPRPGPPGPDRSYPGPPSGEQPWSGQPYPGQPGYPGQPSGEQPWSSPPGSGQPYPGQPGYPGQPYQGQPNPDVPASVPPQPGFPPQPQYAPPGYPPQGGYPQPGPPMPGYPAPRKKSRALPITLVSIALVLVLCVGGGTAIYLAGRNTAEGLAGTLATTAPTPGITTAPPRATITIVEPRSLGGRPRVTDPKFADTVEQLEKNLALLPGSAQSVGAIYGNPAKRDLVMVVAAKSYVRDPKDEVDSAFAGSTFGNMDLTGVSSIPAGPLGGAAKCGKGSDEGVPLSLCVWADEGSSGLFIWYFTSLSKAKKEFVRLRGQVEQKSN
jgi:hypothetical protein